MIHFVPWMIQNLDAEGDDATYLFWIIVGLTTILMGIFHQRLLRSLGLKLMSEVLSIPNLKHSAKFVEQIGRWLVILIGGSFLIVGLGEVLPSDISHKISLLLLGLSGLMFLIILGVALANWKAR